MVKVQQDGGDDNRDVAGGVDGGGDPGINKEDHSSMPLHVVSTTTNVASKKRMHTRGTSMKGMSSTYGSSKSIKGMSSPRMKGMSTKAKSHDKSQRMKGMSTKAKSRDKSAKMRGKR